MIMLKQGSQKFFAAVAIFVVSHSSSVAEELPIRSDTSHILLEKTAALEAEIQHRQQEATIEPEKSKEYKTGYTDGYNKAVLDLVKAKLLNDSSLIPKQTVVSEQSHRKPHTNQLQQNGEPLVENEEVQSNQLQQMDIVSEPLPALSMAPVKKVTAEDFLQKSNSFLMVKNWSEAINAATEAILLDSALVDSYIVRSWAYAESGETQKALSDTNTAIRLDANNALAYNNRAYINELMNNSAKAKADYHRACELQYAPACDTVRKIDELMEQQRLDKINALSDLSYEQFQQKDWRGVIETTTKLLNMAPNNSVALVNRAGAYTELGEYKKALEDCNSALIIEPNMAIAYNNKGYALELMGDVEKAALEYETACVLGVQQSCADFKRLSQKISLRGF